MQNVRNEGKMDFIDCAKKAEKLIAQPSYERFDIIRDDLVSITRRKTKIYFDKPIYVGSAVLDVSKLLMYEFHYDFIKQHFPGEKSRLCFTDTDSFLYEFTADDVYDVFLANSDKFDWSNYADNHPAFVKRGMTPDQISHLKSKNKKVVGKFKDETGGVPILSFAGLRSKVYSYLVDEPSDRLMKECGNVTASSSGMKFKGQPKRTVARKLAHENFVLSVQGEKMEPLTSRAIRSYGHKLYTLEVTKASLNAYDDKRWIREDGLSTYAYGHKAIPH